MSNSFKIFLIIFISINLFSYAFGEEKSISDYVEQYGKAVVLITAVNEKTGSVGLGSGFLVSQSGVIATNYHVIEGAYPAMVKLINKDIFEDISVVDFDSTRDIAIIKIKGWGLPYAKLGDSESIRVGDKVFVIGNPKGLENTVTEGLLSAKRDISELIPRKTGFKIHQISAPISPGSSGSPIFNARGEVIGIATLTVLGGQNLNFSIPINYVRGLISETPKMSLAEFSKRTPEPTFRERDEAISKEINLSGSWQSLTTGNKYTIRHDGDFLYIVGGSSIAELRKSIEGFRGKWRYKIVCRNYKICTIERDVRITSFTEKKIEGWKFIITEIDCNECNPKPDKLDRFAFIRI